jgi:hypothetical protein
MEEQEFDLDEFRNQLLQLEKELTTGIKQDKEYQGELDEVIASLGRLKQELKDKKYQQVLPDIFNVLQFLNMVEENFEEEEEEEEEED